MNPNTAPPTPAASVDPASVFDILAGGSGNPAAPPAPAPAPPPAPPAPAAGASPTPGTTDPPAPPAPPAPAPNPLDDLLAPEAPPAEVTFDDKTKEAIKAIVGTDDLASLAKSSAEYKAQIDLLRPKAEKLEKTMEHLSKMPWELAAAMRAVANGEDYMPHLKTLLSGVSLSKPAAQLDKYDLTLSRFPDAFTPEEVEAMKGGDAALAGAFDKYHKLAAKEHDADRQLKLDQYTQAQEANRQAEVRHQEADARALATFKSNPKLANAVGAEFINDFTSGKLEAQLYNPDGTKTEKFLVLLAQAAVAEKLIERAREAARKAGGDQRELEIRRDMPDRSAGGFGGQQQPPKPGSEKESIHKSVMETLSA